jgi:hypothetical protein
MLVAKLRYKMKEIGQLQWVMHNATAPDLCIYITCHTSLLFRGTKSLILELPLHGFSVSTATPRMAGRVVCREE